ncbi:MAG: cysteine desulfurase family protein [bacterium]|nr:cysteine desulfurase family protein [bacterium]
MGLDSHRLAVGDVKGYFDYNATSPMDVRIRDTWAISGPTFGNPSSLHKWGREAKELVEDARYRVGDVLGVSPECVIFTSSATEANNLMLRSFSDSEVVVSAIEHPSVAKVWDVPGGIAAVDASGVVTLANVKKAMGPKTTCVAVMAVNNETGIIQPVHEIGEWCEAQGVHLHVDGVQAFGRVNWDWEDTPFSSASFSAHKLYGPKGIGVLVVKTVDSVVPLIKGGSQEMGFRSGTESPALAQAMALSMELAAQEGPDDMAKLSEYRDTIMDGILNAFSDARILGNKEDMVATTLNVAVPGVRGEAVMMRMDLAGFAVSTGSACSTGSVEPSPVIMAMGHSKHEALESVRISMGRFTSEADVLRFIDAYVAAVMALKNS